jgi:putative ABC transport system permease protein
MILKIAWKNVWRSKGRSMVVMGSIVVGIWALIFGTGFMNGFMESYMADVINHDVSNVQVHHPEFKRDFDIKMYIPNGDEKAAEVLKWQEVKSTTTRVIVNGMIASSRKGSGVQIRGIDVEKEASVTRLDSLVKEGAYFEGIKRNPIVIGEKLASELKVKLRSKVVLTFNDAEGELTAVAFRVAGIVKSSSVKINELYVFVRKEDLSRNLAIGSNIHEIAIVSEDRADDEALAAKYNALFAEDKAESWREIAPELALMQEMYSKSLYILLIIIMLALVFGIVNTMLMAVLERMRELGMLMAIGMNKVRVFFMVVIETIYLSTVGAPIGLLLGWLTIRYFRDVGVDLSSYSEGLESFGYSSVLYPYVESNSYFIVTVGVIITAIIGALYPAWKAVKLNPVEALHKI